MAEHCQYEARIAIMESCVKKLDHDVNGNGKPGLRTDVTRLIEQNGETNKKLDKISKDLDTRQDKAIARWGVIIGVVLTVLNIIISNLP